MKSSATHIALPRDLFNRVMASEGKLEAGMIANMNTHLLPREPKLHVRLLGERKTLCGKTWMPGGWQFTSRGSFGHHAPWGTDDRDVCKGCRANAALDMTIEAEAARVAVLRGARKPHR